MRPWGSTTIEERFWRKITKRPDGCWVWTAAINNKGYGKFWNGKRIVLAHRYSYALLRGPIADELDHLCATRLCVRPDHLEPVTHRENIRRGMKAQQTHCIHGHEFTPKNTHTRPNGTRQCRTCHRLRERARSLERRSRSQH